MSQKNFDINQKVNRLETTMNEEIKRKVEIELNKQDYFDRLKGEIGQLIQAEMFKYGLADKAERGKVHE
jgi:phage host-nuclease inhibitor protein Gam